MSHEAVLVDLDDTLYPYPPCNEAGKRTAFGTFHEPEHDIDAGEIDADPDEPWAEDSDEPWAEP